MSAPFRIGMIGAGGKAASHAKSLVPLAHLARLTGVADIDLERAQQVAAGHGAKAHARYQNLFADADVILVVSPNHLHYEQTLAAAECHKHVFCEKPLSLHDAQAEEMVDACRAAGVKLGVGVGGRFGFTGAELLRLLHAGELGQALAVWDRRLDFIPPEKTVPWRRDPAKSGGVLFEYLSHELDWLRVAGGKVRRVFGRKALRWSEPHFYASDHVWATLEFESGLTGTLEGSVCAYAMEYTKGVLGTKGTAFTRAIAGQGHCLFLKKEGEKEPAQVPHREGGAHPLQAFLEALARGAEPPAGGQDGLAVTALSNAILRSAESGQSVELPERQR